MCHRKLLATRACFRKVLGFQEQAVADLQHLADTRPDVANAESSAAFNLAYFSSQFYGPKPEYLDAARNIRRSLEALDQRPRDLRRLLAKMGLTPIFQPPGTCDPHPNHHAYPHLPRELAIVRRTTHGCADVT